MIPETKLIRAERVTSRLGFGCSRLHHLPDSQARQKLLEAAFELGFRHFDVAPSYGHGINERELGLFLGRHRASSIVATKFGMRVSPFVDHVAAYSTHGARAALGVQSLVRRVVPTDEHVRNLTPSLLEQAVLQSLKRLKADHIDIHFIHEPAPGSTDVIRALLPTYRKMQRSGMIGLMGLSGNFESCRSLWRELNEPDLILQMPEGEWTEDCPPDISFGAVVRMGQSYFEQGELPEADAEARIRAALVRRPRGALLVSTSSLAHLKALARAGNAIGSVP
jgi:D-threo-aldose 1-dehydrogenase